MPQGICREEDGWGNQDSVRIRYENGSEMEMSAEDYEARGYQPPLHDLPPCPSKDQK